MDRRRMFHVYKAARECGPYDERPMLPEQFEMQMHLSRNDRPQPFYLICDHDSLLIQMSGTGRVEFKEASVLYYTLEAGDFIYVPAGMPHRLVPETESVQARLKAVRPKLEAVAWFCQRCGSELWREEWELADESSQAAYLRASSEFNAREQRRRCGSCGTIHPALDLAGLNWREIADELREEQAAPA